ncbi:glutaredoxin family protein [Cytobacillus sp. Hz8]|uniref:glutaredoxin family protein n=1 Tax=Cytobacillus sp. Hz8 TaxID=3347168 RepID=UPI0035E1972E
MKSTIVTLYTRSGCHLCDHAKEIIKELKREFDFFYEEIDINESDELTEQYGLMIPVVKINGVEVQYGHVDKMFIYETLSGN